MTSIPLRRHHSDVDDCPALTIENLSAGYGGHHSAIEGIAFAVNHGERVAVIGPNGAGKSTLFKVLAGLIPHATGEISLHGEDCRTSHTMIGYVPQYDNTDWEFPVTVQDVVMMGRIRKIGWLRFPRQRDWQAVEAALQQVGMAEFGKRQIGQLSGGQRRRVFIARALVQETDVLLLDEPFSGVDVAAEHEIMETLDRLQSAFITVLLSTHDLNLATTQANRLLVLNRRVIAYGTAKDTLAPDVLSEAYGGRVAFFQKDDHMMVVADEHRH
jgi:ABC-type Mn2+/Zn2+ transport system ATPase subunit